jgi:hypothetical protein
MLDSPGSKMSPCQIKRGRVQLGAPAFRHHRKVGVVPQILAFIVVVCFALAARLWLTATRLELVAYEFGLAA